MRAAHGGLGTHPDPPDGDAAPGTASGAFRTGPGAAARLRLFLAGSDPPAPGSARAGEVCLPAGHGAVPGAAFTRAAGVRSGTTGLRDRAAADGVPGSGR